MCLFCEIINKKISSQIVFENDRTLGILDVQPIAPGHTLVLPKDHAENILDMESKSAALFFEDVREVVGIINSSLSPDGFTLGINHGKASGQAVDHLHFHIIPRWKDDKGRSLHGVVDNKTDESLEEIAEKIKNIR